MKTLNEYYRGCGDLAAELIGDGNTMIHHVTNDSREAKPGSLFVAIHGSVQDGRQYLDDAVNRGAAAVMYKDVRTLPIVVPAIRVFNDYESYGRIAECHLDYPSRDMRLVGITGTNGKTTTACLLYDILCHSGERVGMIGTINHRIGDRVFRAEHTTPTPLQLQRLLSQMRADGVTTVIMEVSSHALHQGRMGEIKFDLAMFTNLSGEHLDYHGSMDRYYETKRRLFSEHLRSSGVAVVNADDDYGVRLVLDLVPDRHDVEVRAYGFDPSYDCSPGQISMGIAGSSVELCFRGMSWKVNSPLIGQFNLYNTMAAVTAARELGVPGPVIRSALSRFKGVPGRLQRIAGRNGISVFIDYAHTDDAIANVARTLKPLCKGRLTVLFGCGGDRDRDKRPRMLRAAAPWSDRLVITSDNPRDEDPDKIIAEILCDVSPDVQYEVISDRRQAIASALDGAREHDTVLVAGKGHEDYQEIKGQRYPFDDFQVCCELMRTRRLLIS